MAVTAEAVAELLPDAQRLARSMTRWDPENVAAEAIARTLRYRDGINDQGALRAYVRQAVRTVVYNETRRRTQPTARTMPARLQADARARTDHDLSADLADAEQGAEQGARLADALAALTDAQRQLLAWRYGDERLDQYAIADRLGITPANARQRLHRALAAARAAYGIDLDHHQDHDQ